MKYTICFYCKNCYAAHPPSQHAPPGAYERWKKSFRKDFGCTTKGSIDFVTGKQKGFIHCKEKNLLGNCPDFEKGKADLG